MTTFDLVDVCLICLQLDCNLDSIVNCNDIERVEFRGRGFDFEDGNNKQMRKLLSILHNPCIKRIHIDDTNHILPKKKEKQGDNFLQLLVPESPKAIELNQRLETEISDEQHHKLYSWQIEKLENDIKNEIELKYNTFDINELSNGIMHDNGKYEYQWSTNIQMLHLRNVSLEIDDDDDDYLLRLKNKHKLTPERVKTAYKNVRALAIDNCVGNAMFFVSQMLLNNLSCQLESLHLDCDPGCVEAPAYTGDGWQFKLFNRDDPGSKEKSWNSSCIWFPRNVKHLCLYGYNDDWSQILANFIRLTKLKHLTIRNDYVGVLTTHELSSCIIGLEKIPSFIQYGLESFHLTLGGLEQVHVFGENRNDRVLCRIHDKIIHHKDGKLASSFILKVNFEIYCGNNHEENSSPKQLIDDLRDIYSSLCDHFDNVIFAFKSKFYTDDNYKGYRLLDQIKNQDYPQLKSDDNKVVQVLSMYGPKHKSVAFNVVFRSKGMLDYCYMEPKYEFECYNCRAEPVMNGY